MIAQHRQSYQRPSCSLCTDATRLLVPSRREATSLGKQIKSSQVNILVSRYSLVRLQWQSWAEIFSCCYIRVLPYQNIDISNGCVLLRSSVKTECRRKSLYADIQIHYINVSARAHPTLVSAFSLWSEILHFSFVPYLGIVV